MSSNHNSQTIKPQSDDSWVCENCGFKNPMDQKRCERCGKPRPADAKVRAEVFPGGETTPPALMERERYIVSLCLKNEIDLNSLSTEEMDDLFENGENSHIVSKCRFARNRRRMLSRLPAILLLLAAVFMAEFVLWDESMTVHLTAGVMSLSMLFLSLYRWHCPDKSTDLWYSLGFIILITATSAIIFNLSPVITLILLICFFTPPIAGAILSCMVLSAFLLTLMSAVPPLEVLLRFQTMLFIPVLFITGAAIFVMTLYNTSELSFRRMDVIIENAFLNVVFYGLILTAAGFVCLALLHFSLLMLPEWITPLYLILPGAVIAVAGFAGFLQTSYKNDSGSKK